jgi:hypothetical protein
MLASEERKSGVMALRISMARTILVVAITAAGLGVIQFDRDWKNVQFYRHYHGVVIGVLPMTCLLLFGILTGLLDLARRGECHCFLVGFEVFGWASLFAYLVYCSGHHEPGDQPLYKLTPIVRYVFRWKANPYRDLRVMSFHMAVFFVPELGIALLGGWASSAMNIVLARRSTKTASERP